MFQKIKSKLLKDLNCTNKVAYISLAIFLFAVWSGRCFSLQIVNGSLFYLQLDAVVLYQLLLLYLLKNLTIEFKKSVMKK